MQHAFSSWEINIKIWGGKLEGKIPFGRRVGRWGNNTKVDAKVTVCEDEG